MVSSAVASRWGEPRALDAPPPGRRDAALVVVLAGLVLVEVGARDDVGWRSLAVVAGTAPLAALAWRRTHPLPVVAVVLGVLSAADLASLAGARPPAVLYTTAYVLVLPYALVRWGSLREATAGLAVVLAFHLVREAATGGTPEDLVGGGLVLLLPAVLGAAVRHRSSSRLRETERVQHREREQLARELHDTVAHHVSAIAVRAQAGRVVAARRPESAVEALAAIEEEASRALAEMRTLVGVLREGEPGLQRGVADIRELARDGPLRVEVELSGDLDGLRPSVGEAAYRLAQEAVTNAARHARGATRVTVRVVGDQHGVHLDVEDDGEAPAARGARGYGLVGMAERTALLGGTLRAGPGPERGWAVTAVLPRADPGTPPATGARA